MATNIAEVISATNRNIRIGIADKNTTRNGLARASGLAPSTFNRKLDGHAEFTLKELGQIADALDLELKDILPQDLIADAA